MLRIKALFMKILEYLKRLPPKANYIQTTLEANGTSQVSTYLHKTVSGSVFGTLIIDSSSTAVMSSYHVILGTNISNLVPIVPASASTANFRVVVSSASGHEGDIRIIRGSGASTGVSCYPRFFQYAGNGEVEFTTS